MLGSRLRAPQSRHVTGLVLAHLRQVRTPRGSCMHACDRSEHPPHWGKPPETSLGGGMVMVALVIAAHRLMCVPESVHSYPPYTSA